MPRYWMGGFRLEPYDPDAKDADGDNVVQEGTVWERPAGTYILDAAGNHVAKGTRSGIRTASQRIVDKDGNVVNYEPKRPRSDDTTMRGPEKSPRNPKTPLGLVGYPTLGEMGSPTVTDYSDPPAIPKPPKPVDVLPPTAPDVSITPIPERLAAAVPPPPGTLPIPDGWVRLYHYTGGKTEMGDTESVDSIKQFGLLMELSRGSRFGEPDVIWASPDMPSLDRTFVEFVVKPDDPRVTLGGLVGSQGPSDVGFASDIKPEEIIAVHEPWHDKYRYLSEEPYRQSTLDGEYDGLSDTYDYGPAIEAIKRSRPDPVLKVPTPPREEEPPAPQPINANGLPYVPGADPVTPEAQSLWRGGKSWEIRDPREEINDSAAFFQKQADDKRSNLTNNFAGRLADLLGADDINTLAELLYRWDGREVGRESDERDNLSLADEKFPYASEESGLTNKDVVNGLMEQRGVSTLEDLINSIASEAEQRAVELFREGASADTIISMPKSAFRNFLGSGRFLTQFESGTSGGTFSPTLRATVESRLMNIPVDLDPSLRPVYGHGDVRAEGEIVGDLRGSFYVGFEGDGGGFHLVLRNDSSERTTTVYGDSLSDEIVPVLLQDIDGSDHSTNRIVAAMKPVAASWFLREILQSLLQNDPHDYPGVVGAVKRRMGKDDPGQDIWESMQYWMREGRAPIAAYYFEKQVHGGVSLKDVATVVVSKNLSIEKELTPSQLKILEDAGVEVVHEDDYIKKAPNAEEAVSAILNAPWAAEDPSTRFARIQMGVSDLPAEALENFIETDATTGLQVVNEVAIEKKRRELLGQVREFASRKRSEGDLTGEDREVAIQAAEDLKAIVPLREAIKRHISAQDDRPSEQRIDEERDKVGGLGNLPPATEWPPVLPYDPTDLDYLGRLRDRRTLARRTIYKEINDLLDDWTTAGGNPEELGFADDGAMVESLAEDAVDVLEQMARAQNNEKSADSTRIALTAENVLEVLSGGRYLTQFESDSSRGRLDKLLRMKVEEEQFGVRGEVISGFIDDLEPRLRPVYGVIPDDNSMGIEDEQPFMEGQYGDSWLVLKRSTRERSTYTFGDSLSKGTFGQPLNGGGDSLVTADDYYLRLVAQIAFESATDEAIVDREDEYAHLNFLEVQIHGGVSLYDIEEIYVPFDQLATNEVATMQRTASILGIKVTDSSPQPFLYLPKVDAPDIKEEPLTSTARSAFALVQLSNRIEDNNGVRIRSEAGDLLLTMLDSVDSTGSWAVVLNELRANEMMYQRLVQEHLDSRKDGFPDLLDSELEEAIVMNAVNALVLSEIEVTITDHKQDVPDVGQADRSFTSVVVQREVTPPLSGVPEKTFDMILRLRQLMHGGAPRGQGDADDPEFAHTPEQEAIAEALGVELFEKGVGDAAGGWHSQIDSWELIDADGRLELHVQGSIIDDEADDFIGDFDRTVNLLDNSVLHHAFTMGEDYQDKGTGKTFISQTFVNFINAGITRVDLVATSDPGSGMNGFSVWPRLGAEIVPESIRGEDTPVLEALLGKQIDQITAQDVRDYTDNARATGNYDEIMYELNVRARMTFDLTNGLPPELGGTPPDVVEEASDYISRIIPPLREEMRQLKSDEDSLKKKFTDMLDVATASATAMQPKFYADQIFREARALLSDPDSSMEYLSIRLADIIDETTSDVVSFEDDLNNLFPDLPTDIEIRNMMYSYAANTLRLAALTSLSEEVDNHTQSAWRRRKSDTIDITEGEEFLRDRTTRLDNLQDRMSEIWRQGLSLYNFLEDSQDALGVGDITIQELLDRAERVMAAEEDPFRRKGTFTAFLELYRDYTGEVNSYLDETIQQSKMDRDFAVNRIHAFAYSLETLETLRAAALSQMDGLTGEWSMRELDELSLSEVIKEEAKLASRNLIPWAGEGYGDRLFHGDLKPRKLMKKLERDRITAEIKAIDEEIADLQTAGIQSVSKTYSEVFQKVRASIRNVGGIVLARGKPSDPRLGIGFAGDVGPDGLARVKAVRVGDNGIYDENDAVTHLLNGGTIAEIPDVLVWSTLMVREPNAAAVIRPELANLYALQENLGGNTGENHLIISRIDPRVGVFIKGYQVDEQGNELLGQELAHLMGFPTLPGRWGGVATTNTDHRFIILEHSLNHIDSVSDGRSTGDAFIAMSSDAINDFGLHQRILHHLLNLHMSAVDRHEGNVVVGRDVAGNYAVMPIDMAWAGTSMSEIESFWFGADDLMMDSGRVHAVIQGQLDEKRSIALKSALRETIRQARDRIEYMVDQRDLYVDDIISRLMSTGASQADENVTRTALNRTITRIELNLTQNTLENIYRHYGISEDYQPPPSPWRIVPHSVSLAPTPAFSAGFPDDRDVPEPSDGSFTDQENVPPTTRRG